jgi:uncharacterized protein with HEPN domain
VAARSPAPRLQDIVEAIEHLRTVTAEITLDQFEADWQKRWLVERGMEIISEASRHLGAELKTRHPEIPWPKLAGIGNVLRHEYERIAPEILWNVIQNDVAELERVCREELARTDGPPSRGLRRPR